MKRIADPYLLSMRGVMLSTAVSIICLCSCTLVAAGDEDTKKPRDWGKLTAGQAVTLQIKTPDGTTQDVAFRYCPAGDVVVGDASDDTAVVLPMKPFLLMETELPVGLAKDLAPPAIWRQIADRLLKPIGVDRETGKPSMLNDEQARQAMQSPDGYRNIPLTYINLDEAAQICQAATDAGIVAKNVPLSPIEAWEIRIPTHAEWQYGCRSYVDRDSARVSPHFSPWPSYENLPANLKGQCADQWEGKLGRPAGGFTGSQTQVLALLEKYDKGENPEPAAILGAFLAHAWWKDPASRVYTAGSKTGPPRDVGDLQPNAWGLRGMSDNACEWVLCVSKPGDVRSFCSGIVQDNENAALPGEAVIFLAGGSTREYLEAQQDWQVYAIWGGRPMKDDVAGIAPRTWEEARGESPLVEEYSPGCRFVADRILAPEWVVCVRAESLKADGAAEIDTFFASCESTIGEIMVKEEQSIALRALASYETIARYKAGDASGARTAIRKTLASPTDSPKKPKLTVADMIAPTSPSGTNGHRPDSHVSEDELFSRALLAAVSAETNDK
jgi:formylglycine-generating enzyme required for sulfatase activity